MTSVEEVARDLAAAYMRRLVSSKGSEEFAPADLGQSAGNLYTGTLRGLKGRWPAADLAEDAALMAAVLATQVVSKLQPGELPAIPDAAEWLADLFLSAEAEVQGAIQRCRGTDPYGSGAFRIAGDFLGQYSPVDMVESPFNAQLLGSWIGGLYAGILEGFKEANEKYSPSPQTSDAAWSVAVAALPPRGGWAGLDMSRGEAAGRWIAQLYASILAIASS